jgi:chromosome segregation ATPase
MAGTRDTYRVARVALIAVAVALLLSMSTAYLIGASKLSAAEASATDSARVLVQENLATYVTGADLTAPVSDARARQLDAMIDATILNGGFAAVTIWNTGGTIVYSSDTSLIGTRIPEERYRLKTVLKDGPGSTVQDGMFSTRVPLAPEGTDATAVAQLDRTYAQIWGTTAKPWRLASLALGLMLLAVLFAIYQVSRMASRTWKFTPGPTPQSLRAGRPAPVGGGNGTDLAQAQPDFRRAGEELARAQVRATTAEERAAVLQDQYRKTLEELHAAKRRLEGAALETPSRPDPEIEERLLKAEGHVRLLEGQLQSVKAERDKLASDAQEHRASQTPDPKLETRASAAQAEAATLRAELETAHHELAGVVKELEATRKEREKLAARSEGAGELQEAVAAAEIQTEQAMAALEASTAELAQAQADLADAREALETLGAAEQRAVEADQRAVDAERRAVEAETRVAEATERADTATARVQEIETAATGDVEDAAAQLGAANARVAELQASNDDARREAAAARAEAESFRATAGTERAELEDAFRAELASRERDLLETSEAREHELRRATEAREQELQARLEQAETQAQVLAAREQVIVGDIEARDHDLTALRTREAELIAEMEALKEEVRRDLETHEVELRAGFAAEQASLLAELEEKAAADRGRFEEDRATMETREASLRAELDTLHAQLDGATGDLGTTDAELQALRLELATVRADGDGAKQELRTVWHELEAAQQELTAALEQAHVTEASLQTARAEAEALRDGSIDADGALRESREEAARLHQELSEAREELARTQAEVQAELTRGVEAAERAEAAERELQEASMRAAAAEHDREQLRQETDITGQELVTLREIAGAQEAKSQEREALEEMLRVTQDNLSGSNDRAAEIERRAETAEQELVAAQEQIDELESRLRQIDMSQAVKSMRREETEVTELVGAAAALEESGAAEDRRATTPFMKELSLEAKKSLTSILGLSLTLKHKTEAKEQAPLLRQLAAYARRLDHTVADLLDADKLVRGEVELHPRRTDLEALVQRVVEESQVGNDHDVRMQTQPIVASVDPVRTEQILMGLLRGATDRTPLGSAITIRLTKGEGGALISVEDAEISSDASLSPVVSRFADVQGGWAKVESRPNGGSAFRVFLPAEGMMPDSPTEDDPEIELTVSTPRTDLEIVVSDELDKDRQLAMAADDDDPWAAGQLLVQELQKLSRDD